MEWPKGKLPSIQVQPSKSHARFNSGRSFDYNYNRDVGRLLRCRRCNLPMRLRGASEG